MLNCSSSESARRKKFKQESANTKKRKVDEPKTKVFLKQARRVSKRDRLTIDYLRLNDGSDHEGDSSDEEYGRSTRRKPKNCDQVVTVTELSEQHQVDEDEVPDHEDLMSDPGPDISEDFDGQSTSKERQHVGSSLKGVWKFYDVKALDSFYEAADPVKRDHSIKCRFDRCRYETTDSKRNTATTNMRGHLFSFHRLTKDDVDGSKSFEQIISKCVNSDILNQIEKSNRKTKRAKTEEALLDLFGDGSLPFSLIEDEKFQRLFDINDLTLPVKSRATLSRKLRERGDGIERQVRAVLSSQDCLSLHLALDLWQSPSKDHYLSVIGSFVDEEFERKEVLLTFSHFNEMHTGENLARAVFSLLDDFGGIGKLTGITSDGASNNLALMSHLERLFMEYRTENIDGDNDISKLFDGDQWCHCLSHINNLLSTTFLKSSVKFADTLIKVRKTASIIRLSDVYRDKFSQICKTHSKGFIMPPGEIVTRWNSTYELLLWFLKFKQPLMEYLKIIFADASERIRGQLRLLGSTAPFGEVLPDRMELMLSTQEWRELGLMKQLLEPFHNFTLKFNKSQTCPSEALTTFFYFEEFLRDMGEASTPSAVAVFFARHGIKGHMTELSQELRDAAHATCHMLEAHEIFRES